MQTIFLYSINTVDKQSACAHRQMPLQVCKSILFFSENTLCDNESVVLRGRLMCMSEKLLRFPQMNEANEKSFRSIRRNEWTRRSPRLRHHWSRPIEQQGEISHSHLLRTIVPLILACFCLHNRQLTPYVACVSLRSKTWEITNSAFQPH